MDSAAKVGQTRSANRVLEAISTVSALLDRTIQEVKSLDAEFDNRVLAALQESEASLEAKAAQRLEAALTEMRQKLEEQFAETIRDLSSQWEGERSRLNAEVGRLTQAAAQWEGEKAHLNGELERLARVQAATQAEAEKAVAALKAATAAKNSASAMKVDGAALNAELQRVEGLIKEISVLIEDPNTELSAVIRKNVQRAELESYLKGIRFALDGGGRR